MGYPATGTRRGAVLVGGFDGLTLDPKEVLEARLFSPGDLPDGMPEAHRELAASL
jgi:hypothetical protein